MGRISSANRNFIVAYILLVGLPLLGLASVLRTGRALSAPISVDGVWKFGMDGADLPAGRCSRSLASLQDSLVTISQSGKGLTLSLDNGSRAAGSGVIEGTALNAAFPLSAVSANEPGCGAASVFTLAATIDPKSEPRSMLGTISVDGCASCPSVKYRAARQARSARGEAR
jgi:hypothetical protein